MSTEPPTARIPRDEMMLAYALQNEAWDRARSKLARRVLRTKYRKYSVSPRVLRRRKASSAIRSVQSLANTES